jgi:hypothetical protein
MPLRSWNGDAAHLLLENMSIADLVDVLPTGEQCEELISAYFRGYHTMKPTFNGHAFLAEARDLQLWYGGKHQYPGTNRADVEIAGALAPSRTTCLGLIS